MSAPDRRAMLDRTHPRLSVRRQCELVGAARSGAYRGWASPAIGDAEPADLELMRRLDELFMAWPFLGSRRMAEMLSSPEGRRRLSPAYCCISCAYRS